MKKEVAWKKLKYYKDTLRFPSEELGKITWFQKWQMKRLIKAGLPKYTDYGLKYSWRIEFNISEKRDIFSGKLINKICNGIYAHGYTKNCYVFVCIYNIEKGILYNAGTSDVNILFNIEDYVEKEK